MKTSHYRLLTVFGIMAYFSACMFFNVGCGDNGTVPIPDTTEVVPMMYGGDSTVIINALTASGDTVVESTTSGLSKFVVDPATLLMSSDATQIFWGILELGSPIPPNEFYGFVVDENDSTSLIMQNNVPQVYRLVLGEYDR